MTTLIKRNANGQAPATTFSGLVDQLFQDNLGRFFDDQNWGLTGGAARRHVPVNIRDNGNAWLLDVIAPGFDKADFKLQMANGLLTISAEHKEEKQEDKAERSWIRREYRHEAFTRSFSLDDTIDTDHVEAKYNNGVLQLTLPKKAEAQPISRSIEIQ